MLQMNWYFDFLMLELGYDKIMKTLM